MKKRFLALCLCLCLCVALIPAAVAVEPAMLAQAEKLGLLVYSDIEDWDKPLTRLQTAELIAGLLQLPLEGSGADCPFTDCEELTDRQKAVILTVMNSGLMLGVSDTTFQPHATVTREQMAVIIVRACYWKTGYHPAIEGVSLPFDDTATISSWAYDGVRYLYAIIGQPSAGLFRPTVGATGADTLEWLIATKRYLKSSVEIPNKEALHELLHSYLCEYGSFDAEIASLGSEPRDVLVNLLGHYVSFHDLDVLADKETWFREGDPDYVPDPLERFLEGGYYTRIVETDLDWFMETILNIAPADIATMKAELDKQTRCYCHEGYYYTDMGGYGGFIYDTIITSAAQEGDRFYVTVDQIADYGNRLRTTYFAVVELKNVDGVDYWTLHSVTDSATDLPEGFDYVEPVFPEGILDGGMCGKATTWTLDKAGALTISGKGEMEVTFPECCNVKRVVVEEGVTGLKTGAFQLCDAVRRIDIPASATHIDPWATHWYLEEPVDVFYAGTREQWEQIEIGEYNTGLWSGTIHFAGEPGTPAMATVEPAAGVLEGTAGSVSYSVSLLGRLTLEGDLGADEMVLAAMYDGQGRLTGVEILTADQLSAWLDTAAAKVKLFWLGDWSAPQSPAETLWER